MMINFILLLFTIALYQFVSRCQNKWQFIWLNPMFISIIILIPLLIFINVSYDSYTESIQVLNLLLEPAIVALGFPLYQQLKQIKLHWKKIISLLSLGVILVISISFISATLLINKENIAIALSLKSVTTPIGITLTEQLYGDSTITAFAIMIAGLLGALLGPAWLNFIHVRSAIAQGIAIGAASHVIGTAVLAKISAEHAAYSSMALISTALLTAIISPVLIPALIHYMYP